MCYQIRKIDSIAQTVPIVSIKMISACFGKMLARTLSGGFTPPAAWQITAVLPRSSADLLGDTDSSNTSGTV